MAWTKDQIRKGLEENDLWVVRGIERLYSFQTQEEQASEGTRELNGLGFNSTDAQILSSFAKQIERWRSNPRYATPLSHAQMTLARKKIMKYAGQLTRVANGEI